MHCVRASKAGNGSICVARITGTWLVLMQACACFQDALIHFLFNKQCKEDR